MVRLARHRARAFALLARWIVKRVGRRRARGTGAVARDMRATNEDPAVLEREADDAERRGDLERAVRLRFRAGLLRLGDRGAIEYRPSLTTSEVRGLLGSDFVRSARGHVRRGRRTATSPPTPMTSRRLGRDGRASFATRHRRDRAGTGHDDHAHACRRRRRRGFRAGDRRDQPRRAAASTRRSAGASPAARAGPRTRRAPTAWRPTPNSSPTTATRYSDCGDHWPTRRSIPARPCSSPRPIVGSRSSPRRSRRSERCWTEADGSCSPACAKARSRRSPVRRSRSPKELSTTGTSPRRWTSCAPSAPTAIAAYDTSSEGALDVDVLASEGDRALLVSARGRRARHWCSPTRHRSRTQ